MQTRGELSLRFNLQTGYPLPFPSFPSFSFRNFFSFHPIPVSSPYY